MDWLLAIILAMAMWAAAARHRRKPLGWKPLSVDAMETLRSTGPSWRSLRLAAEHEPTAVIFARTELISRSAERPYAYTAERPYAYTAEHEVIVQVRAKSAGDAEWVSKLCAERCLPYAGVLTPIDRLRLTLAERQSFIQPNATRRQAT